MNLQPFLPKLPAYLIKTTTFPYQLDGVNIDFKVTYTVFGEMMKVENDFIQLPIDAQKMMLGAEFEEKIAAINGYGALFKYKIPLVVFGYYRKGIWKTIFEETNAINNSELDWFAAAAPLYYVDNWVMELWRKFYNEPKSKDFDLLVDLFFKPDRRSDAFTRLNQSKNSISLKTEFLIPLFLTLSTWSEQANSIKAFGTYPSRENFKLLVAILKKETKKDFHGDVLRALSKHNSPKLKNVLMDYYYSMPKIADDELSAIFEGFSHFATKDVAQLLWKNLENPEKMNASITAITTLKKIGVAEKKIAKKLAVSLKAKKHLPLTLSQFNQLGEAEYLPSLEALLALVKKEKQRHNNRINTSYLIPLIERVLKNEPNKIARSLLNFENKDIQRIAVVQLTNKRGSAADISALSNLLKEGKFVYQLAPYFEKLIKKQGKYIEVALLLPIYEQAKHVSAKEKLLQLMRRIIKKKSNSSIYPFLLAEIEKTEERQIKIECIITLRLFPNVDVIIALENIIKESSDKKVKRAAVQSLGFIKAPKQFWKNQIDQRIGMKKDHPINKRYIETITIAQKIELPTRLFLQVKAGIQRIGNQFS